MKLTDVEYDLIKDRVLGREVWKCGRLRDSSLFVGAVLYIAKTGCGWRQLPKEYGKWKSVWQRFFDDLKSKNEEIVAIDSTSARVHQEGTREI